MACQLQTKKPSRLGTFLLGRELYVSAEEIRARYPQFCILIIGKANAGKTTILCKVCIAKPDTKPIVHDANGKKVKVWLEKFAVLAKKLTKILLYGIIVIVTTVFAV